MHIKLFNKNLYRIFGGLMGKKLSLILVSSILIIVIVTLVYVFLFSSPFLREEYVGGRYNCRIGITGEDPRGFEVGKIFYVKGGVEHEGYYNEYLRDALDWIKTNTPENAVFLNWWDYGHMIVGYSERDSVVKNPSEEALVSVADPTRFEELDPHEMIVDVAKALTTTNESETVAIMEKYGATYLLVTVEDGKGKPYWIFHFAGLDFADYMNISWQGSDLPFDPNQYNELGKETVIYRVLIQAEISGLTQIYSDGNVKIYKRSV
jgi:asparagine N-glycosylation enzyme membrane subunit Stt3